MARNAERAEVVERAAPATLDDGQNVVGLPKVAFDGSGDAAVALLCRGERKAGFAEKDLDTLGRRECLELGL